jgi:hypothetical protein
LYWSVALSRKIEYGFEGFRNAVKRLLRRRLPRELATLPIE